MNLHASADLEQPVKEDDAVELVLCVSLPDDERQRDGGRQFVAAVGLGETRLSGEGRREKGEADRIRYDQNKEGAEARSEGRKRGKAERDRLLIFQ